MDLEVLSFEGGAMENMERELWFGKESRGGMEILEEGKIICFKKKK